MIIYRIEHKEHEVGPYHEVLTPFSKADVQPSSFNPMPNDDNISMTSQLYCGFKTLKQLTKWFSTRHREILAYNNYHIVRLSISNTCIHFGKCQLAFLKEEATVLNFIPIRRTLPKSHLRKSYVKIPHNTDYPT